VTGLYVDLSAEYSRQAFLTGRLPDHFANGKQVSLNPAARHPPVSNNKYFRKNSTFAIIKTHRNMQRMEIRNFGPVKEGQIDINKVTVFVGNQGSGKSTVAKLTATFKWIEKALVRGDYDRRWFEGKGINRFRSQFLPYHRIESYLNPDSVIEYHGDAYIIKYRNEKLSVHEITPNSYSLPQIMYVPAERNLLTYIKGVKELKLSSASLQDFNTEYCNAKDDMKDIVRLPVDNVDIEYNRQYGNLYLRGDGYRIEITEASSGFQSFVPL
jgi:hypothetical protein